MLSYGVARVVCYHMVCSTDHCDMHAHLETVKTLCISILNGETHTQT